ncbi:hypothetical protein N0V93_000743 [Gnomoniopsis smithogilvyi]|uniref:NmrA-like domain-containing protein n=1 Tax=Gnomoniopsis smithogilvyi TaxID=1191159 RepID=A0A9W8Z2D0_9PEZI|nr:hypothetical protein N0V93_000743 [Gnomoniopsis smithogilvyi]
MSPKYAKDQPAGFINRIQKVTIVGASGRIGSYFTKHLLATGIHYVTALTRAGSTSKIPDGVRRVEVDYTDEATLVNALQGQQFLIITLAGLVKGDPEKALINAAAKAGVPYVMPNSYTCDPLNEKLGEQQHIGAPFRAAKAEIERLGVSSWLALATGFWYEWSLVGQGEYRFGCGIKGRTMTFFDDGEEKITTSTWDQCGRAVAALLSLKWYPEDESDHEPAMDNWANNAVYIASFRVSQKDLFDSVKRVTGTTDSDWKIEHVSSEKRYQQALEKMRNGDLTGFSAQMYTRIFFPTGEGDHTKHSLANEALGLPEEDIDESTREGLRLDTMGMLTFKYA